MTLGSSYTVSGNGCGPLVFPPRSTATVRVDGTEVQNVAPSQLAGTWSVTVVASRLGTLAVDAFCTRINDVTGSNTSFGYTTSAVEVLSAAPTTLPPATDPPTTPAARDGSSHHGSAHHRAADQRAGHFGSAGDCRDDHADHTDAGLDDRPAHACADSTSGRLAAAPGDALTGRARAQRAAVATAATPRCPPASSTPQ